MPAAPRNTRVQTAQKPPVVKVLLGPSGGGAVAPTDENDTLIPLRTSWSAGGRQPDVTDYAVDLAALNDRLVDLQLVSGWNSIVELYVLDADDVNEESVDAVHWGEYSRQLLRLNERGESAVLTTQANGYHFGNLLTGMEVWDPIDEQIVTVDQDPVFNPEIDGDILFNRSERTTDSGGATLDHWIWIDPESVRTTEAETVQGDAAVEWSLNQAVIAVQRITNESETHIKNTPTDTVDDVLGDAPAIRNVRLPRGRYLPELLDRLLEPHGYGWYIDYQADSSDRLDPQIAIFKRGEGVEKDVYLQRPGETLDPARSTVPRFTVEQDISRLFNRVEAHGSLQQREVTIELQRGWDSDDDSLDPPDLNKIEGTEFGNKPNVWRLWTANLDGTYNSLRTENSEPDLSDVFDEYVPKRRVFEDLLVFQNNVRVPPVIEWWDADESAWKRVGNRWPVEILEDQAAIYFNGEEPPHAIWSQGSDAKVRITATLTGDTRIKSTSSTAPDSPNTRESRLFLDVSDRFHDRSRQSSGTYQTLFSEQTVTPDVRDDQSDLDSYVSRVRDVEEAAIMAADLQLFGLHFGYEPGDLVRRINGREISLNRLSDTVQGKRYLQITAIQWDWQQQTTTLITEAFGG